RQARELTIAKRAAFFFGSWLRLRAAQEALLTEAPVIPRGRSCRRRYRHPSSPCLQLGASFGHRDPGFSRRDRSTNWQGPPSHSRGKSCVVLHAEASARQVLTAFHHLPHALLLRTAAATRIIASKLRSTSSSVVAHDETLMRMAVCPCQ